MNLDRIPALSAIQQALVTAADLGAIRNSLSAIGAVRIPAEWDQSERRLLMLGQETGAMDISLDEMMQSPTGIEEIANSYEWFDFAEGKKQRSSPFWRAHRGLADKFEGGSYRRVMWSNLVKVQSSTEAGSGIHKVGPEIGRVIDWQAQIVLEEVRDLAPQAVLFFTGPTYDWILKRSFPGVEIMQVEGSNAPAGALARLRHPDLPESSLRTYHPAYLQRRKQVEILDEAIGVLEAGMEAPA